jgi:transposase
MKIVHEKCAGIDVGKTFVLCCALVGPADKTPESETERFDTTSKGILAMGDWLAKKGVTHVAMESTGVYWKPIHNLLEGEFEVWLINAAHAKGVPGRKTDVEDCRWIAELMRHGLLNRSFIPPPEIRALREMTRYRRSVIQEKAREANRIQKVLEDTNIKLASVATDILGKSGRAMLRAIVQGETSPEVLASLAKGRLQSKAEELQEALTGKVRAHHRFVLRELLDHVEYIEKTVDRLDAEIEEMTRPFEEDIRRLEQVPGLGKRTIEDVIAELGTDMSRFPTSNHCASWAGLCPTNNESAGKRHKTRLRKGSVWLKTALVQASWPAARSKNSYFRTQFLRLKSKRGAKKAIVAVAHSLLDVIYALLKNKRANYFDLGADYFIRKDKEQIKARLVKRLGELGFSVALTEKETA